MAVLELGPEALLIMLGAVAFGALVKAVTGLGVPPVAIPVFAAFVGIRDAVVAMAVPVLVTNLQLAWRYRAHRSEVPNLGRLVTSALVGSVVGAMVLDRIPERLLAAAIGIIVLGYLALMVRRPSAALRPTVARALAVPVAGTAGALQGATGLSAQVIVTYLAALRMSRGGFVFAVAILLQVSGLGQFLGVLGLGLLTPLVLQLGLATTIVVVTVLALVTPLAERLPQRVFELGVRAVLFASSLRLLYDAFLAGA
ncbi:MAG: TSUP family transporter [Nitriliruptoraceae bacterium]|jgi:uncharacterized membrane protein YfcA